MTLSRSNQGSGLLRARANRRDLGGRSDTIADLRGPLTPGSGVVPDPPVCPAPAPGWDCPRGQSAGGAFSGCGVRRSGVCRDLQARDVPCGPWSRTMDPGVRLGHEPRGLRRYLMMAGSSADGTEDQRPREPRGGHVDQPGDRRRPAPPGPWLHRRARRRPTPGARRLQTHLRPRLIFTVSHRPDRRCCSSLVCGIVKPWHGLASDRQGKLVERDGQAPSH